MVKFCVTGGEVCSNICMIYLMNQPLYYTHIWGCLWPISCLLCLAATYAANTKYWLHRTPLGNFFFVHHVMPLTHWGRVTHICIGNLTIIGSDNGLSPGRHQAIIWINAGILSIRTLGTKFSEILIYIHTFSFKKMHLKMSSGKCQPFCLGLNVLIL